MKLRDYKAKQRRVSLEPEGNNSNWHNQVNRRRGGEKVGVYIREWLREWIMESHLEKEGREDGKKKWHEGHRTL